METENVTFCYLPHHCSCPEHELMVLDPSKMKRYEREGYPKFIKGHMHKGHIPWNKNKHWDEQTLEKITKTNRERTQSSDYIHPMQGKSHTPEAKEKNRIAHLGNKSAEGHVVSEENKKLLSELHKGNTYAKGCIHSEESKLKQSESMKEKSPWNKGLVGVQESPMKGKNHTPESIELIKENTTVYSGEDHWNWQGGITSLYKQIRFCDKSNKWRNDVFARDSFMCQDCKDQNKRNIIAHHIKQFSEILHEHNITTLSEAIQCPELWDINNGVTLCEDCHNKIPKNKYFI